MFPLVAVTMYVPGLSATNAPLPSTYAPLPLTDQRVATSFAGSPFALNRTTSPVRADFAPALTSKLRKLLFTTLMVVVLVAVPALAVIVALPGPTAVITPPASTVATCGSSDVQLIGTPVRGSPLPKRVTASSGKLLPTASGALIGVMSIVLTPGAFTMNVVKPGLPPTIAPTVT